MVKGILSSCLLIIAILLIREVSQGHIKKYIQYSLWIIVALKLLVFPVPWVTSSMAIFSSDDIKLSISNVNFLENESHNIEIIKTVEEGKESTATTDKNEKNVINETSKDRLEQVENVGLFEPEGLSSNLKRVLKIFFIVIWTIGAILFAVKYITQNYILKKTLNENSIEYKQKDVPLSVYLVDDLASPCLYNGKIYVREELLNNPTQRKHILAHEYCHYKHKDSIWSLIRCICLVVYWWNPLVWLAVKLSKIDCELACDEAVLDLIGDEERISYGRTLLSLMPVKGSNFFVVASTMEGSKSSMKDRIKFLAKKTKIRSSICVVVVFMAVVTLACSCTVKPKDSIPSTDEEIAMQPDEENSETDKQTEVVETEKVKPTGNDYSVCTDIPAIDVENYARNIANIFYEKNWDELSENLMYPISINGKSYNNREEFVAEDWNTIFSNEYIEELTNFKVEEMWANWQGICISNGNIWLGQDASSELKIIAINYTTEKDQ